MNKQEEKNFYVENCAFSETFFLFKIHVIAEDLDLLPKKRKKLWLSLEDYLADYFLWFRVKLFLVPGIDF